MPHQNRVTPSGVIIATTARGMFMGNRGCLHDRQGNIRRAFVTKRWIICLLNFKGVRRTIMTPGRWTELFFLDEATALAAGHRPCAYCQRTRFNLFRERWTAANPALTDGVLPTAPQLDATLHQERMTPAGQKVTYAERLANVPDGVMLTLAQHAQPYLRWHDQLLPWHPGGYGTPVHYPAATVSQVLTPRSVVRALAHGYPVELHPSAFAHA